MKLWRSTLSVKMKSNNICTVQQARLPEDLLTQSYRGRRFQASLTWPTPHITSISTYLVSSVSLSSVPELSYSTFPSSRGWGTTPCNLRAEYVHWTWGYYVNEGLSGWWQYPECCQNRFVILEAGCPLDLSATLLPMYRYTWLLHPCTISPLTWLLTKYPVNV